MAKEIKGNPVARAAILRKGGVHEKGKTAKRQHQKRQLDKLVDDYSTDFSVESREITEEKNGHGGGRFFGLDLYLTQVSI